MLWLHLCSFRRSVVARLVRLLRLNRSWLFAIRHGGNKDFNSLGNRSRFRFTNLNVKRKRTMRIKCAQRGTKKVQLTLLTQCQDLQYAFAFFLVVAASPSCLSTFSPDSPGFHFGANAIIREAWPGSYFLGTAINFYTLPKSIITITDW